MRNIGKVPQRHNAPIPTRYLREMLGLILKENSLRRTSSKDNGTAMGTKMEVSFANFFHGGNGNGINPTKRYQAKRMETLH